MTATLLAAPPLLFTRAWIVNELLPLKNTEGLTLRPPTGMLNTGAPGTACVQGTPDVQGSGAPCAAADGRPAGATKRRRTRTGGTTSRACLIRVATMERPR